MTKQVSKQLINSWEWLDSFCLTQRGDCGLACGQHGIVVVQVNEIDKIRKQLSKEEYDKLMSNLESVMQTYALEDTIVARYDEATFVVVLHYLTDREELTDICQEIEDTVRDAKDNWTYEVKVTIGAAECHHDPDNGYKCAARLAMDALKEAKLKNKEFIVAPDTLRHHPLAVAKATSHAE